MNLLAEDEKFSKLDTLMLYYINMYITKFQTWRVVYISNETDFRFLVFDRTTAQDVCKHLVGVQHILW